MLLFPVELYSRSWASPNFNVVEKNFCLLTGLYSKFQRFRYSKTKLVLNTIQNKRDRIYVFTTPLTEQLKILAKGFHFFYI